MAIIGAGVPLTPFGFSGYYSKDSIIAQALSFKGDNPLHGWMFYAAVIGAGMTAFYMFRLWYLTFAGEPRDRHVHQHAHESPRVMIVPLVILAAFAVAVGWNVLGAGLEPLLEQSRPEGTAEGASAGSPLVHHPPEHHIHKEEIHVPATLTAFATALAGFILATLFYGVRKLDPADARGTFAPIHRFLLNKWWFDELYDLIFVRPVLLISRWVAVVDRKAIDWVADNLARAVVAISRLDDWIDRVFVDGLVNQTARWTYAVALKLRTVQTGNLRQYVMMLVVGVVGLFVLISLYWSYAVAG